MSARIVTGLVITVVVIALFGWAPTWAVYLFLQAAAVVAAMEYFGMAQTRRPMTAPIVGIALAAALPLVAFFSGELLFPALGFFVVIIMITHLIKPDPMDRVAERLAFSLTGLAYIGVLFAFPVLLAVMDAPGGQPGRYNLLLMAAVVWLGDSGAYFAGKFLGKRKLYPKVSPGKSVAGAIGGIGGSVFGVIIVKLVFLPELGLLHGLVIGVVGAVLEQVGDLSESLFKRSFAVKDSGTILPGHGGILDRFDGFIFVGPFLYTYLTYVA